MQHSRCAHLGGRALVGALALLALYPGRGAADEALETVVRGVQHREKAILTLRGYLSEANYYFAPVPGTSLFQVEFVLGDGTMRYAACAVVGGVNDWRLPPGVTGPLVTFPNPQQTIQGELQRVEVVEDGQRCWTYDNLFAALEMRAQESSPPAAARQPFAKALMLGGGSTTWGEMLSAALEGRRGKLLGLRVDEAQRAAYPCDVVTVCPPNSAELQWEIKLWVSEELGYAVVRSEARGTDEKTGALGRAIVHEGLDLQPAAEGIFLPGETREYWYRYDLGLQRTCTDIHRWLFHGLQVNVPVRQEELTISVPLGARIPRKLPEGTFASGRLESTRAVRELQSAAPPEADAAFTAP